MFIDEKEDKKRIAFSMQMPGLKMSSIASFKRWEAEAVILIIPPIVQEPPTTLLYAHPKPIQDTFATIYTGITRARSKLFIFNMGNDASDIFFSYHIQMSRLFHAPSASFGICNLTPIPYLCAQDAFLTPNSW